MVVGGWKGVVSFGREFRIQTPRVKPRASAADDYGRGAAVTPAASLHDSERGFTELHRRRVLKMKIVMIRTIIAAVVFIGGSTAAVAQNYTFDARNIALGGVGDSRNVAADLIDESRPYGSILLPLGAIQLIQDFDRLNPSGEHFDLADTFEYAASPLHYVVGRGSGDGGRAFIDDLTNASLNDDLTAYSGFIPDHGFAAEGLSTPGFGKTIKVRERGTGFDGIYLGAGAYMSASSGFDVDPRLIEVFASGSLTGVPDAQLLLTGDALGQLAVAITGGYRGRFALPGLSGDRDGLYVGANYNYLHGLRHFGVDLDAGIETMSSGLVNPFQSDPIALDYRTSSSGRGYAIDLGVGAVINRWEVGFGVAGLANRIEWTDFERTRYRLPNLFTGETFIEETLPLDDVVEEVRLPVIYTGNAAYHHDRWSVIGDVARGFQGTSMHAGFEQRFERMDVRAGGRYSRERWHPSAGVGFNLSPRVALDLAAFGTSTNIEQKRKLAFAMSFRLNRFN
jgi:hypothetical protein